MNPIKADFILQLTQEQVVVAIHRNDDTVLQALYREVFLKVRIYILKNSGNEAQAEDIFQDAFLAFWRNIKEEKYVPREENAIQAYLYTIAKNKWRDYLRSSEYKKFADIPGNSVLSEPFDEQAEILEEEIESQARINAMRQALGSLGKECKNVLTQFYFDRLSIEAIAANLKIGSASARNKKYRCLEKLRKLSLANKNNEE